MPPHLLAAISSHGFGHVAQTAPVLNELKRRVPELRLTVLCAAPSALLRSHLRCEFEHWPLSTDLGVVNRGALTVLAAETARAYTAFHSDWDDKVAQLAHEFARRRVDLVFADVPYLPLAAAQRARIPSIALCSLNWADILRHYVEPDDPARALAAVMTDAYAGARVFLQPEPSMPMSDLPNVRRIGPIARVGVDRGAELRRACGIDPQTRLVLISLGGIKTDLGIDRWPRNARVAWLVEADWGVRNADARVWDSAGLNFIDVLRSSDVLVTKPGYGSFAEAACNGARVLYVPRLDWPEEPYLVEWLPTQVPCAALTKNRFLTGEFHTELERLLTVPRCAPASPSGIADAAEVLHESL
jgi:hypothetical protein